VATTAGAGQAKDPPRRQTSLAHLTVLDTTPPELVAVAAAAGFRTIGIRLTATPSVGVPPYDILSDGPLLRETLLRLADTGVSVLDTEFLRFEPGNLVGIPEGFLEVSARLGAQNVLVMSAEPEETRTVERFCELCDRAASYGLEVCLEFAIYTGVRTLAQAARIAARSKRSNASVLVDALHFSRSGGIPAHLANVDPRLFRYAQIWRWRHRVRRQPLVRRLPTLVRWARAPRLSGALATSKRSRRASCCPAGSIWEPPTPWLPPDESVPTWHRR
jgi:hypothetical protein